MDSDRQGLRILIAGLGNILLRDDGVGVHAVQEFQKNHSPLPGVLAVEVGTAVLDALHLFEWADRILAIDAMHAGGSAGTLYSARVSDIEDHSPQASLHELSLLGALGFLSNGERPEIAILGVEPKIIDYGIDLSPEVEAALPAVIRSVREIVNYWRGETRPENNAGRPDFEKRTGEISLAGRSTAEVGQNLAGLFQCQKPEAYIREEV